ncbi:MAG: NUDIX domain-containing protein [Gammaproteobacteria bacterium]|jgi:ADP-ribose pyrophosphatase YjhB (NUDIX family)|nr:NUDIX domain-containing protein [Gammaproteobacteria bacterium]MBT4493621.1 NUDIX domain-containing protein [Gammaproteobacteria bacterium]
MSTPSLKDAIAVIEAAIDNPAEGLPEEVFRFMTRITPLVNVDLLIRDPEKRTLLAWRHDEFAGAGWHVPGGIVRYKESLENRLREVAKHEIGRELRFRAAPIAIHQMWKKQATRAHFFSVLYECFTDEVIEPDNDGRSEGDAGFLKWHDTCPDDLIMVHEQIYRPFIGGDDFSDFAGPIPCLYFPDL